jgi:hypothetical protein
MKSPLILVVSEKMDSNRKKSRNEDGLIRMGSMAREFLGLSQEKTVELWPDNGSEEDRINRSRVLEIFEAFKEDLKALKISSMPEEDYRRVGFVTSRTFETVCRDRSKKKNNGWISDTIEDTVIGGDPEFILMDSKGAVHRANQILNFGSTLGSDGSLAEIRPAPSITAEGFIKNIGDILTSHPDTDRIKEFRWLAGSYYHLDDSTYTIGGHVHIGTPATLAGALAKNGTRFEKGMFACLKKVLDEFVSVPAMKIDGVENSVRRRAIYGKFSDIRTEHGRLEHRTLSGQWLAHPRLAAAVLGSMKAVSHAFFKALESGGYDKSLVTTESLRNTNDGGITSVMTSKGFAKWDEVPITNMLNATIPSGEIMSALELGEIEFKKPFFNRLEHMYQHLTTYEQYRDNIDLFLQIVSLPAKDLKEIDNDIKHGWLEKAEFIV